MIRFLHSWRVLQVPLPLIVVLLIPIAIQQKVTQIVKTGKIATVAMAIKNVLVAEEQAEVLTLKTKNVTFVEVPVNVPGVMAKVDIITKRNAL